MKYKALIFDLYGTLVKIHTDENKIELWEKLALFYGYNQARYTPKALQKSFLKLVSQRDKQATREYEGYPDLPIEPVLKQLFIDKGIHENLDNLAIEAAQILRICSTEYIALYPHVLKALAMLKEEGYQLYLLSNAQAAYTQREIVLLGLENSFDQVYLSSNYGVRKPDAAFFNILLKENNLNSEDCLMIGNDCNTDIIGAHQLNIDTLLVQTDMVIENSTICSTYTIKGNDWIKLITKLKKMNIL